MTLRVSLLSPEDLRPHGGGQRLSTEAPTILTVSSLSDEANSPVASEHSCHHDEGEGPQQQHEPAGTVSKEEIKEKTDSVGVFEDEKKQQYFDNEPAQPSEAHEPPSWRPFWLQRIIILFFGIFFLACVVVLPVLLSISEKYQGLADAPEDLITGHAKVWKLVPTAVITLILVFWSRVELQTLRYFPWASIQRRQEMDEKTFNLDYTTMITPLILIRSLRNKHFFIFLVSLTSIILKVQVVLSAGLFYVQTIPHTRFLELQVLDSFASAVEGGNNSTNVSTSAAYFNAKAIKDFGLGYPFGVAKEGAYQTFHDSNKNRGSVDTPLTSIVDGLFMGMDCRVMENYTITGVTEPRASGQHDEKAYASPKFDLQFKECGEPVHMEPTFEGNMHGAFETLETLSNDPRPCSSLPQQQEQFIYFAALLDTSDNSSDPKVQAVGGVLCAPRAYTVKVQVVDDGISPNLTTMKDQDQVEVDINLWRLLGRSVPNSQGPSGNDTWGMMRPVEVDREFHGQGTRGWNYTDESLYDSETMHRAVKNLTESLGPFVAHYQLRRSDESKASGSSVVDSPRLIVNKGIALAMTVLFGVSMLVAFWAGITSNSTFWVWYRDPATLLGSMLFFSPPHLSAGSEKRDSMKGEWASSFHSPIALRAWLRIIFMIYALALVVGLGVSLQTSKRSYGLFNVSEGTVSQWWGLVPALAMLLVALYTTSSDMALRDLTTLSNLSKMSCSAKELDLSLVDMLGVKAWYYSLRLRSFTVTLSQSLAILCGVLATLSNLLFSSQPVPEFATTTYSQKTWLGYPSDENNAATNASSPDLDSLFFMQNPSDITWPQWTYDDLVFPELGFADGRYTWTAGDSVKVQVQAAKLQSNCFQHEQDDYVVTPNHTDDDRGPSKSYTREITRNWTCPDGSSKVQSLYGISLQPYENEGYANFGVVRDSWDDADTLEYACGDYQDETKHERKSSLSLSYIWGQFSIPDNTFTHVSYWTCNYTWSETPAEVKFVWQDGSFYVDEKQSPVVDQSKAHDLDPPLLIEPFNNSKAGRDAMNPMGPGASRLDADFQYILEPSGSLKQEAFNDSSQDGAVLAQVRRSRATVEAQKANLLNRLGVDEDSETEPTQPGTLDPVSATITSTKKHRLVQDTGITITLMVIISLAIVFNALALLSTGLRYFLGRRGFLLDVDLKGLAPYHHNSIPMMEALLHGSNSLTILPRDAQHTPDDTLHQSLSLLKFRMGWFTREGREKEFTIGILNDINYQFDGSNKQDHHHRQVPNL